MYGTQSEIQRIQSKLQRLGQSNPHRAGGADGAERQTDEPSGAAVDGGAQSSEVDDRGDRSDLQTQDAVVSSVVHETSSRHNPCRSNTLQTSALQASALQTSTLQTSTLPTREGQGVEPLFLANGVGQDVGTAEESDADVVSAMSHDGASMQADRDLLSTFLSTNKRYSTPAGQQALREMEKVIDLHDAVPEAVAFVPPAWPQQVSAVDAQAKANVQQLAYHLRQGVAVRPEGGDWDPGRTYRREFGEDGRYGLSGAGEIGAETPEWESSAEELSAFRPSPRFTLAQGGLWLAIAIVVRMAIDRLLLQFPGLWIVMAAMVLTPVAIALYQTAVNPQSTVHSGRRLLVIMMGLLIGGQL